MQVVPITTPEHMAAMNAASRTSHHRTLRTPDPVFDDRAACRKPWPGPDLWFDEYSPANRETVVWICTTACPLLEICREWAIGQPRLTVGIFGGMSHTERQAERTRRQREAAAWLAHRRELQRGYTRRAEKLRRQLGKAETPEHQRARYAANPEPQKAKARSYYSEHRDEILAKRRKARAQPAA
jgi:hypothetical protein